MKIALAQIDPIKGGVRENIKKHLDFIRHSARLNADAVFFPELSLCGYEPKLAESLKMLQDDERLDEFQNISDSKNISIGLGFPQQLDSRIQISMGIFQPKMKRKTYSKQYLHSDELRYFNSGNEQILIELKDKKIAPAICYEALQADHLKNALKMSAEVYLASVVKSAKGIDEASAYFAKISKENYLPVCMVNSVGFSDDFLSGGSSSVWNKQGKLIAKLDEVTESLLVVNLETEEIIKYKIA